MLDQKDPSRELVEFWNGTLEPKFTRFRHVLTRGLSDHSDQVLPDLNLEAGERVLDVGCGFGEPERQPSGTADGIVCGHLRVRQRA